MSLSTCTQRLVLKTVRAGERDCPQDNPLSKRARSFDSKPNLALFLYVVGNSFFHLSGVENFKKSEHLPILADTKLKM